MKAVFFLLLTLSISGLSAPLTLKEYLDQVKGGNESVKAMKQTSEAALSRAGEAGLLYTPNIFAEIKYLNDAKPTANPAFQGNRTLYHNYSLGVSQLTSFGMAAKLYYSMSFTELEGVSPAFVPLPKYYEGRPILEVSQSFWKNGFGSETQANRELIEAAAKATGYQQGFLYQVALAEAEGTFWKLAIAREVVAFQKESLDRAKRLKEWSARRNKLQLADAADELQAEAGLRVRELEYQAALDEERSARVNFNSLRGSTEDVVKETLPALDKSVTENLTLPEKKSSRLDVKAAEAAATVAQSSAQVGLEKNQPQLDLVGSVALNSRTDERGTAFSQSLKTETPTLAIGLKFQTPIDFGQLSSDREAYQKERAAAEMTVRRKQFEEKVQWDDLVKKFEDAKRRLALAQLIEGAQSKKLDRERERLRLGRSVTYQVILFEQDFASAQLLRLKTQGEVLSLHAQLKTYVGEL